MKEIIQGDIFYKTAKTPEEFEAGRSLFQQYVDTLGVDLGFQDFPNELKTIHKQYHLPTGSLLLAYKDDVAIGCAGIRKLEENVAEVKRMFVKDEFRGLKIGNKLLELSMDAAKALGYLKIRLDTLPTMFKAQALYRAMGFYEIPAYRFNPIEGTVYMEKKLG